MEKDPNVLIRVLEQGFGDDSPEAIAKWRDNRKCNYPSVTNVQRKEVQRVGFTERGAKFLPRRFNRKIFRYALKEERDHGKRTNPNQHSFHNPSSSWVNHRLPPNQSEVVLLQSFYNRVHIDSTGNLIKEKLTIWDSENTEVVEEEGEPESGDFGESITDEEDELLEEKVTASLPSIPVTPGQVDSVVPVALAALAGYGTDTDLEDGEIREESALEVKVVTKNLPIESDIVVNESYPNNRPNSQVEMPHQRLQGNTTALHGQDHQKAQQFPSTKSKTNRQRRKRNKNSNCKPTEGTGQLQHPPKRVPQKRMRRTDREPTLLARLLDDEICDERNAVLGACRFLVQNNFLKGMESSEDVKTELIDCIRSSHLPPDEA